MNCPDRSTADWRWSWLEGWRHHQPSEVDQIQDVAWAIFALTMVTFDPAGGK